LAITIGSSFVDTNEEDISFEVKPVLKVFGYRFPDEQQIFGGLAIKNLVAYIYTETFSARECDVYGGFEDFEFKNILSRANVK
jgi:hypothetical protein